LSACIQIVGWRPGVASIFRASSGTQKSWMTSAESTRTTSALPVGMWISFAVIAPDAYVTSHHH